MNTELELFRLCSVADCAALPFDLQLFAAEDEGRTEEPTETKIRRAREKGQVAKTDELPQALVVIFGVMTIFFMGKFIYQRVTQLMVYYLHNFGHIEISNKTIMVEGSRILETLGIILLPIFAMTMLAAIIANVFQVQFQVSFHPIAFDLTKIKFNPADMIQKIFFSKKVAFNLFKSIVKVVIIGIVAYLIISSSFDDLLKTPDITIAASMAVIMKIAFKILIWCLILLIVLSVPDYIFQRSEYIESLKMTKQEIKEEFKEQQGDPHVKARLKEMQRQMLRRGMIKEVPKADVIVTNPTHFAVALKWDRSKADAPMVIAKGVDLVALKIREIAKDSGVMIIENRPLAREMYKRLDIGDIIPEDLIMAVVEVYKILHQEGKLKNVI